MNLIKNSDAPHWGLAEWAISSEKPSDWSDAIRRAFNIDRCYFLSIYTNVIGNNNGSTINESAVAGIKAVQNDNY